MNQIIGQARAEIEAEDFRAAVDKEKQRIRSHVPWWHRFIPFTITITRRELNGNR